MAKAVIQVTQSYQAVASGQVVITVEKKGAGALFFNETADDATAYKVVGEAGEQFQQTDGVATQVRATGDGWEILVDGTL